MNGLKYSGTIVSGYNLKRSSFPADFAPFALPVRLKVAWKPYIVEHDLDKCFKQGVWDAKATPEVGLGVGTILID